MKGDLNEFAIGRVIWTEQELLALPQGSVVVDDRGTARQKRLSNSHMGYGWTHAGNGPLTDAELADGRPMLVVHVGSHIPAALVKANAAVAS